MSEVFWFFRKKSIEFLLLEEENKRMNLKVTKTVQTNGKANGHAKTGKNAKFQ